MSMRAHYVGVLHWHLFNALKITWFEHVFLILQPHFMKLKVWKSFNSQSGDVTRNCESLFLQFLQTSNFVWVYASFLSSHAIPCVFSWILSHSCLPPTFIVSPKLSLKARVVTWMHVERITNASFWFPHIPLLFIWKFNFLQPLIMLKICYLHDSLFYYSCNYNEPKVRVATFKTSISNHFEWEYEVENWKFKPNKEWRWNNKYEMNFESIGIGHIYYTCDKSKQRQ